MQIKFESMQAGQVVSSRLRRSFVSLRRAQKDDLWARLCFVRPSIEGDCDCECLLKIVYSPLEWSGIFCTLIKLVYSNVSKPSLPSVKHLTQNETGIEFGSPDLYIFVMSVSQLTVRWRGNALCHESNMQGVSFRKIGHFFRVK